MSPINNVGVLAFAAAVAAVPHAGHGHAHLHKRSSGPAAYSASSNAAAAYGSSSSYLAYGYGSSSYSADPTGYASSSGPCSYTSTCIWRSKTSVSTVYGYPTASSYAPAYSNAADPSSVAPWVYSYASNGGYSGAQATATAAACSPDVTMTTDITQTITVTYSATSTSSLAAAAWTSTDPAPAYSNDGSYSGSWGSSASPTATSSNDGYYGGAWGSSAATATYTSDGGYNGGYGDGWGSSAAAYSSPADTTCTDDPTSTAYGYATSAPADAYAYGGSWSSSSADPTGYSATWSSAAAYSSDPAVPAYSSMPQVRSLNKLQRHHRKAHNGQVRSADTAAAGFSSKRGLAYNDASLCDAFTSSGKMGWAYNWVSNSGGLTNVPYIPELHDASSTFTSTWSSDASSAIANGAQYLFSFNEPDMPTQANMAPAEAATAWRQYMEPFAGQAKLVAPAVSNSGAAGQGIDWLTQFMAACSDCTIDAVNAHWYDSTSNDLSLFQSQIDAMGSQFGLPVFVGEFGFIGSDSDISSSLSSAMSYLDSNPSVVGYAYFMVADGNLVDGSMSSPIYREYGSRADSLPVASPSSFGETYMS